MAREPEQNQQVVAAMERLGGRSTLKQLYVEAGLRRDMADWGTKTPQATIRRIVQLEDAITKIKPGLYCLTDQRDLFTHLFPDSAQPQETERVAHSYYQGLLAEIGEMDGFRSYVPAQDKNRAYLEGALGDVCSFTNLPDFSYRSLTRYAKSIDTIWFKEWAEGYMPDSLFEVETTTDMKNSLIKFNDLRGFSAQMFIVADKVRKKEFKDKIARPTFEEIHKRVQFMDFEEVETRYAAVTMRANR